MWRPAWRESSRGRAVISKADSIQTETLWGIRTDVYMNSGRVAARTGIVLPAVRPWQSRSRSWRSREAARQFTIVAGSCGGLQSTTTQRAPLAFRIEVSWSTARKRRP